MEREYKFNGHQYWVTVEPAINRANGETAFLAYVSDQRPGGLYYGALAKDGEGNVLLFKDEMTAFTNASAIKESELDRNQTSNGFH